MKTGLLLDNQDYPSDDSYTKLRAMNASCVGMLWTAGTKHRRDVYVRCERELQQPLYILRVGGHPQTPAEWLADARAALSEVPDAVLLEDRLVITAGNEPNIEYSDYGADYGRFYAGLNAAQSSVPILFACPSLGLDGWSRYLGAALAEAGKPKWGIVNLYGPNIGRIGDFAGMFNEVYVGEVNSTPDMQGDARCAFLRDAFTRFDRDRVRAALVFIAGGQSHGAWNEGYIVSEDEAKGLVYEGVSMSLRDQFPDLFSQWEAAGGIENNFRSHLLAIGALPPTKADLLMLADEAKAKLEQMRLVAQKLPFA